MVESKHKSMVNGVMNAFDTSTLAVTSVYFLFISRDWLYLYLFLAVLATICQITLLLVVPESPKWLLIKGKRNEAIAALNRIAVFNKTDYLIPNDAEFVEFVVA